VQKSIYADFSLSIFIIYYKQTNYGRISFVIKMLIMRFESDVYNITLNNLNITLKQFPIYNITYK